MANQMFKKIVTLYAPFPFILALHIGQSNWKSIVFGTFLVNNSLEQGGLMKVKGMLNNIFIAKEFRNAS